MNRFFTEIRNVLLAGVCTTLLVACGGCEKETAAPKADDSPKASSKKTNEANRATRYAQVDQPVDEPEEPAASADADTCQKDEDCVLFPDNDCLGCMGTGGHRAMLKKDAKPLMESKRAQCEPEFKAAMEKIKKMVEAGQEPPKSSHESCKFNAAKCEAGQCVLTTKAQQQPAGGGMAPAGRGRHPQGAGEGRQAFPGAEDQE